MTEYIDREGLLELYRMDDTVLNENGHVPLSVIRQNIMDIPAVDVAPVVHGRWVSKNTHGYDWVFVCSNCGYIDGYPFNDRHNFCPNCGAKMDGGAD